MDWVVSGTGEPLDTLEILGIASHGYHGVLTAERAVGQPFVVDVRLHLDTRPAAAKDSLELSVDYAAIASRVVEIIAGDPVYLIETLAQRIADAILANQAVCAVEVAVHKPNAPMSVHVNDIILRVNRAGRVQRTAQASPVPASPQPPESDDAAAPYPRRPPTPRPGPGEQYPGPVPVLPDVAEFGPPGVEVPPFRVEIPSTPEPGAAAPGGFGGPGAPGVPSGPGLPEVPQGEAPEVPVDLPPFPGAIFEPAVASASQPAPVAPPSGPGPLAPVTPGAPSSVGPVAIQPGAVTPPPLAGAVQGDFSSEARTFLEQRGLALTRRNLAEAAAELARQHEAATPAPPAQPETPAPAAQPDVLWAAQDSLPPEVADTPSADPSRSPATSLDSPPAWPTDAILSIGANLGDALGTLRQAIDSLRSVPGIDVIGVSPLARTKPVGLPDQPDFFNAVVAIRTTLSPRALLDTAQGIEEQYGRDRQAPPGGPRTLDIDIVAFDTLLDGDDELEIPHPRAHQRAFVLLPWATLSPDAFLPGLGGGSVAVLAERAPDRAGIHWLALDWLTLPVSLTGALPKPPRAASDVPWAM